MSIIRLTPLHASLFALTSQGLSDVGERCTFEIDPSQSQVQYEIESNLGPCVLSSARGGLAGKLELDLRAGTPPASEGQFDGGACTCQPDLIGIVPNPIPGQPPLLQIGLACLVLAQRSRPFELDSRGRFVSYSSWEIESGGLAVGIRGRPPLDIPIQGISSEESRSHGKLWIDAAGLHLVSEFACALSIDDPAHDLRLRLRVRGVLRGDMTPPCPSACSTVAPTRAREDVLLLHVLQVGARGVAAQTLDLRLSPDAGLRGAGPNWSFQFAYAEAGAGERVRDDSDALGIEIVH